MKNYKIAILAGDGIGPEIMAEALKVDRDGVMLELEVRPRREKSGAFSSRLLLGITNAELSSEQRAELDRAAISEWYVNMPEGLELVISG